MPNKKVKIAFVIYSLENGGAEKVFSNVINHINRNLFEPYLIVINLLNITVPIREDVEIINLNKKRTILSLFKLFKTIDKINPDVVISTLVQTNMIVGFLKLIYIVLHKNKKCKYILRETAIPSINFAYSRQPIWLTNVLIKNIYPFFNIIIAQSHDMANDLITNFAINKNLITIINNPLSLYANNEAFKKQSNDKIIFITVGNLRPEKGHIRVLEALSLLKDELTYEYWMVGDGKMRVEIEEAIEKYNLKNNVLMLGNQVNVLKYLQQADFFIQGSYSEGFPNSLLEANQVGLPIVAFDVLGGTKEIVKDGFNGFLVPDGDMGRYAETLLKAVFYPFDRKQIQQYIQDKFELSNIIKQYENTILSCVESME